VIKQLDAPERNILSPHFHKPVQCFRHFEKTISPLELHYSVVELQFM